MSVQQPKRAPKGESNFVGAMGNFSIQYNLSAGSIALAFLQSHPKFAQPEWVHYVGLGAIFVGAVLGMLVMGYLGDALGRKRAMVFTLGIQVAGAVACSLLTWGSVETIYTVFCAGRLLLGVGVGGMYPLSASHSAEGSSEGEDTGARVGWAFFWQTPGSMAPYAVALLLVLAVGNKQCSYFSDAKSCAGSTTHKATPNGSQASPLASLAPFASLADGPTGVYCCGKSVGAHSCNDTDISMLVAKFTTNTTLTLGVTIDGEESDCPAEKIHYNAASATITFPEINQTQDCLGLIDSHNRGETPIVKWNEAGDTLQVREGSSAIVLRNGSCGAGPKPSPGPAPKPLPPLPPPPPATCVWNASDHAVCSYVDNAPTTVPALEYRLITGLGIIPPLIVMASAISSMHDSEEFQEAKQHVGSPMAEVMAHPEYWGTLLGTGGTWFLYGAAPFHALGYM